MRGWCARCFKADLQGVQQLTPPHWGENKTWTVVQAEQYAPLHLHFQLWQCCRSVPWISDIPYKAMPLNISAAKQKSNISCPVGSWTLRGSKLEHEGSSLLPELCCTADAYMNNIYAPRAAQQLPQAQPAPGHGPADQHLKP